MSTVKWLALFTGTSLLIAAAVLFGTSLTSGADKDQGSAADSELPPDLAAFTRDAPGIHGETPWAKGEGGSHGQLTWQFGKVTKASGNEVSVRSEDGTTWTWTLAKGTSVHPDGNAPKKGDEVYVLGTRADEKNSKRTADHLVNAGTKGERSNGPVIETPDNCKKEKKKGQLTITCAPGGKDGKGKSPKNDNGDKSEQQSGIEHQDTSTV